MAIAARAPKTSPSSSELLARRLAPCTRVHATSPAANRPGDARAARQVGVDAAAQIVGRGTHRQPIARKVEPGPRAGLRDAGKSMCRPVRIEVRERQVHGAAGAFGLAHHRGGHHIARREIAPAVVSRHERLAVAVDQARAFAADGFRHQEARRRRARAAPWDETARTRDRSRAPRRATPSPGRRRWRRADWWFPERPGRRRPWPAAPRAHRCRPAARRRAGRGRRGRRRPGRRGAWPARDRGREAGDARPRAARACGRSRARSRRARGARGARSARLHAPAPACRRSRDRSRRPSR